MIALRVLSVVGVLVMAYAIGMGFVAGDFSEEGSAIVALAWGKVTLIDLYTGLAFFGAWVAFREKNAIAIAAWWVGLVVLGNLAAAIYLAIAAFRVDTPTKLLLGHRAEPG